MFVCFLDFYTCIGSIPILEITLEETNKWLKLSPLTVKMETSGFLGPHPQNRYAELIPERYSVKVCMCVCVFV